MEFKGDGTETDEVIIGYVEQVRDAIRDLIKEGRAWRRDALEKGIISRRGKDSM